MRIVADPTAPCARVAAMRASMFSRTMPKMFAYRPSALLTVRSKLSRIVGAILCAGSLDESAIVVICCALRDANTWPYDIIKRGPGGIPYACTSRSTCTSIRIAAPTDVTMHSRTAMTHGCGLNAEGITVMMGRMIVDDVLYDADMRNFLRSIVNDGGVYTAARCSSLVMTSGARAKSPARRAAPASQKKLFFRVAEKEF